MPSSAKAPCSYLCTPAPQAADETSLQCPPSGPDSLISHVYFALRYKMGLAWRSRVCNPCALGAPRHSVASLQCNAFHRPSSHHRSRTASEQLHQCSSAYLAVTGPARTRGQSQRSATPVHGTAPVQATIQGMVAKASKVGVVGMVCVVDLTRLQTRKPRARRVYVVPPTTVT